MNESPQQVQRTESSAVAAQGVRVPSLSIIHLMIWLTASAVMFFQVRWINEIQFGRSQDVDGLPQGFATLQLVVGSIQAVFIGLEIAAVVALTQRFLRGGRPLFFQPGHWLVASAVLLSILQTVVYLIVSVAFGGFVFDGSAWSSALALVYLLISLIPVVFFCFAFFLVQSKRWRVAFVVLVVAGVTQSIAHTLPMMHEFFSGSYRTYSIVAAASQMATFASQVAVFVAVIYDLAVKHRRDWAHWAGIAAVFGSFVIHLFWLVGSRLIGM